MFNPVAGFEEPMAEYFVPRNQESMCYGYFLRVRDLLNNQKQHADKDTRLHYQLLLHQMNNALNGSIMKNKYILLLFLSVFGLSVSYPLEGAAKKKKKTEQVKSKSEL